MNAMTLLALTPGVDNAAESQPDAIDFLAADQHHVLDIYAQLMAHETPLEQLETVQALCDAIETHLAAEEQVLYPAVAPAPNLAHATNRSRSSHAMIRAHIQHIRQQIRQHTNHEDELRYLMADVERYFEDEATSLLAESRQYLVPEARRRLGAEMAQRWASFNPVSGHTASVWSRIRNAIRQRPTTLLLSAAGIGIVALVSLSRSRQRAQARSLRCQ